MLVYQLANKINGKKYIGVTIQKLSRRMSRHANSVRGSDRSYYLHNAVRKYGWSNFETTVLYEASSEKEMKMVEKGLIAQYGTLYPNGYNLTSGGDGTGGGLNVPRGEDSGKSVLTEVLVRQLRNPKYATIPTTQFKRIALHVFGVDAGETTLSAARTGKSWQHLNSQFPPLEMGKGSMVQFSKSTKISQDQVEEIFAAKGKVSRLDLAKKYCVTKGHITDIWYGRARNKVKEMCHPQHV